MEFSIGQQQQPYLSVRFFLVGVVPTGRRWRGALQMLTVVVAVGHEKMVSLKSYKIHRPYWFVCLFSERGFDGSVPKVALVDWFAHPFSFFAVASLMELITSNNACCALVV